MSDHDTTPEPPQNRQVFRSNVPLPPRLDIKGNTAQNWKVWKQIWDSFEIVSGLGTQENKYRVATFITCVGQEALEIYNGLPFQNDRDKQDMPKILNLMEEFCVGQTNVIYERYVFNNRRQEAGESVDAYATALRALAQTCAFGELKSDLIRDRIVCGIQDNTVRKKLLQEKGMDLNKCIDICRAAESTDHQMKTMSAESVHAVSKEHKKRDKTGTHKPSQKAMIRNCHFCGRDHVKSKYKCPAYGMTCERCGKRNHTAEKCKTMTGSGRRNINTVEDESEYSSSEEEIFTVTSETVNSVKESKYKTKVFATMEIAGKHVQFQIDSGATCNLIPEKMLPSDSEIVNEKPMLTMYNESNLKAVGMSKLRMRNPKTRKKYVANFVVVSQGKPLLGARAAQQMGLIQIMHENILAIEKRKKTPLTIEKIMEEFPDVFEGDGKLEGPIHLEIDRSIEPSRQPIRKIPVALKDELRDELKRMEKRGIIEKVETPTEWVSSLVTVRKPSGRLRICIDPKPLNKALKRNHYPLPTMDDALPELSKAKVFSVLDVKNGYWHVELDKESSYLTTFGTPFGRYRWLRMPFGICPASEYFQAKLDQAIENLPGTRPIVDDILIMGNGDTMTEAEADHDMKIIDLLQRCRERGIRLNKDKIKLKTTEVPFMGNLLTKHGLKPDPAKVEAIANMKEPTDKEGVERLIGMVNYLARFLKQLTDICEPIRRLTRKDVQWEWSHEQDQAFQKIKNAVTTAPVLRYFNPDLETTLQSDSSSTGLGATIMQNGQPVAYASRALSTTEQNYAQIEKELLAIVFGMEKFHQMTYGRKVKVETDHKPLEAITKKPLVTAPKRLQRMLLRLQNYDIEVTYKRGKEMYIADTLSRAYIQGDEESAGDETIHCINMADYLPISKERLNAIKEATALDDTLQELKAVILRGWPDDKSRLEGCITPYFNIRDELSVQDGILFRGNRCIIPRMLRTEMLQRIHSSHIGIDGCQRRAKECIYWPCMNTDIKDYVGKCETCCTYEQSQPKETLEQHDVPKRPWSKVGADLFTFDNKTYMVLIDYYSNYPEVNLLHSTRSADVIQELKQQFARHGIPDEIISDNGPQFDCQEFAAFCRAWDIRHTTSSPGYPQSNGKAENAVKTIKRIFKKAKKSNSDPWLAVLDFRNTPTQGLQSSPVQRLMNRRTKTLLPMNAALLKPQIALDDDRDITRVKQRQVQYYNKGAKDLKPLQRGDVIRIRPSKLLHDQWTKGIVEEEVAKRSYAVKTEDGAVYRRNRRHLRKTQESAPVTIQETPTMIADEVQAQEQPPQQSVSLGIPTTNTPMDTAEPNKDALRRSGRICRPPGYLAQYECAKRASGKD